MNIIFNSSHTNIRVYRKERSDCEQISPVNKFTKYPETNFWLTLIIFYEYEQRRLDTDYVISKTMLKESTL